MSAIATYRHLLSLADLSAGDLRSLVDRALSLKSEPARKPFADRIVGIYFRCTSTRTRTSFTAAALRLGASVIAYGPADLQTNTGETLQDTAMVLSQYLDALVVRTAGPMSELQTLAGQQSMAVINAMSDCEHPTQALADLSTILEYYSSLRGLRVLYVGEGNSTAAALALAVARTPGMSLTLLTPAGYGLPAVYLHQAAAFCRHSGAIVCESHDVGSIEPGVDVVYTARWQTTGSSKADPDWRRHFAPYAVTPEFMRQVGRNSTIFMHDLPAVRGEEVASAVIDGPQSIAARQAANKLYSAMAVLEWCLDSH